MDGPSPTFNHPVWDRIWSRKIRQVLGGNVRLLVSGSAPASRETLKFLRAALACNVIEGAALSRCILTDRLRVDGNICLGVALFAE
jgi:hypothetical protein